MTTLKHTKAATLSSNTVKVLQVYDTAILNTITYYCNVADQDLNFDVGYITALIDFGMCGQWYAVISAMHENDVKVIHLCDTLEEMDNKFSEKLIEVNAI